MIKIKIYLIKDIIHNNNFKNLVTNKKTPNLFKLNKN